MATHSNNVDIRLRINKKNHRYLARLRFTQRNINLSNTVNIF